MDQERPRRVISPPVVLAATMGGTILVGTVLLRLPFAHEGPPVGWLDALFTATSAVCVTGLIVVDTGTVFTFFGELVILGLIQAGGLGIMTIGTTVLLALGQSPTIALRHLLTGMAGHRRLIHPRDVLLMVFLATLIAELVGAVVLFFPFSQSYPTGQAIWLAIFHSVSAFCNAGFSLWPDSLTRFASDPVVNITVMALIISGGLGFVVLAEVRSWIIAHLRSGSRVRLSLHSKVILTGSALAIVVGALLIGVVESANILNPLPWNDRFFVVLFQSVTARTAGFNTVDISALSNPTLLVLMALMFVGGGSGSMAGGIKLTTAATVAVLVVQRVRGNREIHMFGRAIGTATIQRSVTLAVLASVLIASTIWFIELMRHSGPLALSDRGELLAVMFEVVSAFGTVGLSMGITAALEPLAETALTFLMFIGRVGPLILMDFFARRPPPPPLRHAREELMIG